MEKRLLGNTGMSVSEIAFGGVEIGMPYGVGVNEADMLSESEAIHLLNTALDSGINFFDTAREYGQSESIMGKAFKNKREQVILSSKCKHFRTPNGVPPTPSILKRMVETSLTESLEALRTDYIDLYMLHDSSKEVLECEEIIRFFEDCKKSGVIRSAGVSTYTPNETRKAIESKNWEVLQVPFNLMDQRQESLFSLAAGEGIGIVVRSVLLKGLLSDRGKNLHPALSSVESHIQHYNDLVKVSSADLPTFATRFALSFQEVSSILVGIDKIEYLKKSLEAANGKYLNEELLNRAKELAYPDPDFLNLHTWNIKGWLK